MASTKKLKSGSWRCLVYDFTDDNGKQDSYTPSDDDVKNS